jgi:hypothetical protein
VRFWDARTGENRSVKDLKHDYEVMMVAFGPGGKFVVANSGEREGRGRFETARSSSRWRTPTRRSLECGT